MGQYKSVFKSASSESIIEKSRFIAHCAPIRSEEEALAFIEQIKKKHWDATHNVPVYVLGENYAIQRYSDDGEPSGTAGVPILSMLKNEGITNVVLVITRYFGGIKLGTGGLVRAYTHSAKLGLDAAEMTENVLKRMLRIETPYTLHGKVQNFLLGSDQVILHRTEFLEQVILEIFISPEDEVAVTTKLVDLTSGQAKIEHANDVWLSLKGADILSMEFLENQDKV